MIDTDYEERCMRGPHEIHKPVKDEESAHPIATVWRPVLQEIVKQFIAGNYRLEQSVKRVAPTSAAKADQIKNYIADYGETLVELPDTTWSTSISQWMGFHWELLVDLWTLESGRSDLVLSARVYEDRGDFRFEIDSVHVP